LTPAYKIFKVNKDVFFMKNRPKKNSTHLLSLIMLGFICFNLLLLDYIFINQYISHLFVLGVSTNINNSCPTSCLEKFNQYVSRLGSSTGESYIPLGIGSIFSNDWSDVSGAQASIDSTQFPRIKKVTFEASVQVPTGNQIVWIRLFNVTDKHPVWYSEISMDGTGQNLLISPPINLDSGNKIYQVQIKTQLGYTANLTQSRIHIVTN
jgi:hypothetical protein